MIEQAFLDRKRFILDKSKERATYAFSTTENEDNLVFRSNEMYQVNLRTGTKKQVKRRPEKPISNEDLENIKRYE